MFCEKCGKEIGENIQCECERNNRAERHISSSEFAYLPWIYILAAVWCLIVGEVFIMKEVVGFALLGIGKWFLGGGWLSLLIYCGFTGLRDYLETMCEKVGFENIVFKTMDSGKRKVIAKVSGACVKALGLFTVLLIISGVTGFYRDTGVLFSRGILLNADVFRAIQLSVIYEFLTIIPALFSVSKNEKENH